MSHWHLITGRRNVSSLKKQQQHTITELSGDFSTSLLKFHNCCSYWKSFVSAWLTPSMSDLAQMVSDPVISSSYIFKQTAPNSGPAFSSPSHSGQQCTCLIDMLHGTPPTTEEILCDFICILIQPLAATWNKTNPSHFLHTLAIYQAVQMALPFRTCSVFSSHTLFWCFYAEPETNRTE